ncbi:MAG: MFS transporter [Coriobacteriales bacterium]|jgi:DHA2 family lincomycin resistance protein-like MFS transporter
MTSDAPDRRNPGAAATAARVTPAPVSPENAPKLMLPVMFLGALVAAYNENIINMALVDLMADLDVSAVTAQWLVSGYMVVSTLMVAVMGLLFRRFRIRQLLLGALALLIVGTLTGLFAPNFPLLLAARLVQAVGTGMLIPLMMNTVLLVSPRERLGSNLALGSAMITVGPAIAPVISGCMVTWLGWHFVFLPTLILAVLTLAGGLAFVHSVNDTQQIAADALSVVLAAVMLFSLVMGMSEISTNIVLTLCSFVVCAAALVGFVVRQNALARSGREPLIDLAPMRSVRFFPACLLSMVAMMCTFSMSVLLPLYFQDAVGTTALVAGLYLLVPVLVNAVIAPFAGRIEDSKGEWPLLPVGFLVAAAGFLIETLFGPSLGRAGVFVGSVLVFGSVGCVMSPSQTAGLKTLTAQQHPSGVSLVNVFVQTAACIAPSLYIGIMSATQTSRAADLGSAAAAGLGFSHATALAAVIALVGAVLALFYSRMLRRERLAR